MTYPRVFNHVGITVTNINKGVSWYSTVLGCKIIMPPISAKDDDSHFAHIIADIFGSKFQEIKMAHLVTGDGIGIELFEFKRPKTVRNKNNFEFWKTGIFHLCFTEARIELMVKTIIKNGGKQRSKVWKIWPDKAYKVCYCEDPWGNIIEISSHSYEETWANYHKPHKHD